MTSFGDGELESLRREYPEVEFRPLLRWGRRVVEAWRAQAAGGLYAVIGAPGEVRAALDAAGRRPAVGTEAGGVTDG
ncbi:MAG: hypothetical protein ACRDN0_40525 [Trebonia sp.]